MWIGFFFFNSSSRNFFVSSKAWSICLGMSLSVNSNTNLHPPNYTSVRKMYFIWYEERMERKEWILKIVLNWGFESSGVTSGESIPEESICLSFDPGHGADKSELISSSSTLKDYAYEKSVNQSEGYKEWWDESCDWCVMMDGHTLFRRDRQCGRSREWHWMWWRGWSAWSWQLAVAKLKASG